MLQAQVFSLFQNFPHVLIFLLAFIPMIIWVMFWRNEDLKNPEPIPLTIFTVFAGCVAVFIAIPLEKVAMIFINNQWHQIITNSFVEESLKLYVVYLVAYHSRYFDEAFDYIYYGVLGCIGFAFAENILFFLNPNIFKDFNTLITVSQIRFLGATLLHVLAGASVGIILALFKNSNTFIRTIGLLVALFTATTLHALFNYFIITSKDMGVVSTLSVLWVFALVIISLAERIRYLDLYENRT